MSAHYSRFDLNTYYTTPYFQAQIPKDYPLHSVLVKSRRFRRLPPNLRKLSALAKQWAIRNYGPPAGRPGIEKWYDADGYELAAGIGRRLTDEENEAQWQPLEGEMATFKVKDIPVPAGGFADPDTWEEPEPMPEVDTTGDHRRPSDEQLLHDIASHGRERTADEYGIPVDQLPPSPPRACDAKLSAKLSSADAAPAAVGVWRDWDALACCAVGRGALLLPIDNDDAASAIDMVEEQDALAELLEREGVKVVRPPDGADVWVQDSLVALGQGGDGKRLVVCQPRIYAASALFGKGAESVLSLLDTVGACVCRLPACDAAPTDPDASRDQRPLLEGGDVFRLGGDVLVTMSYRATSPAGYRWLADLLEPEGVRVWPAYLTPEWLHGRQVLMPLREGLCVAYARGFVDGLLPSPITDWNVVELTREEAEDWAAAEGVVLRDGVVVMPRGQKRVARALERKGVDVLEVDADRLVASGGSIRRVVLDLRRDGPPVQLRAPDAALSASPAVAKQPLPPPKPPEPTEAELYDAYRRALEGK